MQRKTDQQSPGSGAVAIITARGGSKRIPGKNIKDFCGRPIIEYAIREAFAAGIFHTVMVSTEDPEIAQIAVKNGAEVPFLRSASAADDYATTSEALLEVFSQYEQQGICFDYACCIYPTAVFLTQEKLKHAMELLLAGDADIVIPVVPFSYPPQRGLVIGPDGRYARMKEPAYLDARSQDLEKIYHDSGQFYFFKVQSFLKFKKLMAGKIIPLILPETEVQDIDTPQDWVIAELKYQRMHSLIDDTDTSTERMPTDAGLFTKHTRSG